MGLERGKQYAMCLMGSYNQRLAGVHSGCSLFVLSKNMRNRKLNTENYRQSSRRTIRWVWHFMCSFWYCIGCDTVENVSEEDKHVVGYWHRGDMCLCVPLHISDL